MLDAILRPLGHRPRIRSLSTKLLLPIVGLMLISLLGSTIAFVVGTALTQDQLLEQQIDTEAERVTQTLTTRAGAVSDAAHLLAHDPQVLAGVQGQGEASLSLVNGRAVVVRDRLGLDLIQVYDASGQARTNLVLSSLYRESSLLDSVEGQAPRVRVVDDIPLLLSRVEMAEGAGTVIAGIDLETELNRLVSRYRMASDLGLSVDGGRVSTRDDFPFDAPEGRSRKQFVRRLSLALGASRVDLLLARSTTDIAHVTATGLRVMVVSSLLTMLLLVGLSVTITRSIAQPVERLSAAAEAVAQGDLGQQVGYGDLKQRFGIGNRDEIGLLASAFNRMVADLRGLYDNLETKVEARTRELATAAEVARAVSASLHRDVVLRRSVELIHDRLGFHHLAIFLIEKESNSAVMREALGASGRLFEGQGLRITVGSKSLVGLAAATGRPHVAQDVTREPSYLKVPELPDTGSEAAIPLLVGERVIGVLDVQSRDKYAFPPETIHLLTTLADQIATGVHNATLYAQQRQAAEHLAEVDQLKSQFLATMSHEVRTPLNSILGFSRMLLKGMSGPLNETQAEDVHVIYESGQHLLALVNDVLDISRINAGQVRLTLEEVRLDDLIGATLDSVSALVGDKPVTLGCEFEPHLPPVHADMQRIQQILLNLLSNAVKFTDAGYVRVRARTVEALNPHSKRLEPFVQVSVSDSGIGIPGDKLADIFKEFTQADNSGSRRFEGTGLGLAITKKLVELQGGRIWVESTEGVGSTFTFILPERAPKIELPAPVHKTPFERGAVHA